MPGAESCLNMALLLMAAFVLTDQIGESKPRCKWQGTKHQQWEVWPHATSDRSLPPITAAIPAKHALTIKQDLGEWQGQSPHRGRAERKWLMFHSASRQSASGVMPIHDRRKREEGKLCQTCIMDKAKAGSSRTFERTLINRVDRWSPVVPHPPENPFSFLVCQSLPHSLPLPKPVNPWTPYRRFSFFGRQYHSREVSQARQSSHQPICLSSSFISCLFSIHIQRTQPFARPFACFLVGANAANVRKCMLSVIHATHYLPPGYLPCTMYLVLPYSDLGPAINWKKNLS